ncbi:MAG TPA: ABC transporter ATP-binding protein [Polyangiales bacterium]|nr:ABC transporter ATP-binding protein [Polyangiales bacterium]
MKGPRRPGLRLIAGVLWQQRLGVALGVGSGLLWTSGKIAVPALVRQGIDRGLRGGAPLRWAGYILLAGLLSALFTGLRRYLAFREGRRAEATLRARLFAHIEHLHFGFHDRMPVGELMSRCHADLMQIQTFVSLIPLTLSNFMIVIAVTSIMLSMQPLLTLLALGSLPLLNVLGRRFSQSLFPTLRGLQEQTAELASVVEESVSGVRVIKGLGAEGVQQRKLAKEADDVYEMATRAAAVRSRFLPALELVPNIGQIFVLSYGGHLVLDGKISVGTLVMFNFYVIVLVNPLRMLGQIIAQAERALVAADRAAQVLATEPKIVDPARPLRLPARTERGGEVRFEDVSFGYAAPSGPQVLRQFDLHIAAGESVALVGETGCGKSTVAKLIARFYDPDLGRVCLDGVDLRDLRVRDLRQELGIVFEETFLFSQSVAANIALAKPEASQQEIERAGRLAFAHDFICALPEGYDTVIGERGFSLSGGQRQRIAIARAILADPRVLILDDATSSVDPQKEHEIRGALAQLMQGRTTIVISHRPVTIALAQRLVLISAGSVVAEGTHDQLLRDNARYQRVLAELPP